MSLGRPTYINKLRKVTRFEMEIFLKSPFLKKKLWFEISHGLNNDKHSIAHLYQRKQNENVTVQSADKNDWISTGKLGKQHLASSFLKL